MLYPLSYQGSNPLLYTRRRDRTPFACALRHAGASDACVPPCERPQSVADGSCVHPGMNPWMIMMTCNVR